VVQPQVGVIYSGSHKKVAEHGGFSANDLDVPILVVAGVPALSADSPTGAGTVVTTPVTTTQIAPTILQALGID
jgi:hypothetical protein